MKKNLSLIIFLILFGATNTIILNLQNIQKTTNGTKFTHPFMQCLCTFFGQIMCLTLYILMKIKPQQTIFQKPKVKLWLIFIAGLFDLVATSLAYIALNMIASSVWQMSRGGVIITTGILSILLLNKKATKSRVIGCITAFVGITLVQIITIIYSEQNDEGVSNEVIGVSLLAVSLIFNGLQFCYQKYLFNKYQLNPLKLVYVEGILNFALMFLLCVLFQYIQCPWNDKSQCVLVEQIYYMENIDLYFTQIFSNMVLILLFFGQIVSISISVPLAAAITKYISPVSRSLADVTRTVLIWGFGLAITLTIGTNSSDYIIEDTRPIVNIIKSIGFIILVIGVLIYHSIFQRSYQDSLISDNSFDTNFTPKQSTGRNTEYLI